MRSQYILTERHCAIQEALLHILPIGECVIRGGSRGSADVRPGVGLTRGIIGVHVSVQVSPHRELVTGPVSCAVVKVCATRKEKSVRMGERDCLKRRKLCIPVALGDEKGKSDGREESSLGFQP